MFEEQVTTDVFLANLVYAVGIMAVILATTGVTLLDAGLVRSKNAIDTVTQKISAGLVCALGFAPIGYAIWMWQYYDALGVPGPLGQAIEDWWIGGTLLTGLPHTVDPQVFPGVDTFQIFYVFFLAFAVFMGAVIHTAGVERMKPGPLFALCFVAGAVLLPLLTFLMWGSTGPLSKEGVHDHVGGLAVYLPLGVIGFLMAWRLGPRSGRFDESRVFDRPGPTNIPLVAIGVVLVLAVLPFFVLGGGYLVPGSGFFGISLSSSGFGLVVTNLYAAMIAAGIAGVILSYWTKRSYFAIAGPFIGYVAGTTFIDVAQPLTIAAVAFLAPLTSLAAMNLMERLKIDEEKLVPLVLAPALYGAVVGGFTEWHTATGGYFGIEEGPFAFQGVEVTPGWQLVGVGAAVGITAVVTLVVLLVAERLTGLRVSEEQEARGLDSVYWPEDITVPEPVPGNGQPEEPAPGATPAPPPVQPAT